MRTALFVTDQLPSHQIGFQQSGQSHYVSAFIQDFRQRGFDITVALIRPKVDFLTYRVDRLPYRIVGRALLVVGKRVFIRSPAAAATTIAWRAYAAMPSGIQHLIGAARFVLRKLRGFVHTFGTVPAAADLRFVSKLVERERPELIMYDGIFNACGRLSEASHWLITHDVKHERAASFLKSGVGVDPPDVADLERVVLSEVGNVVAIQWDEAEEFRRLAPTARVVVVPASFARTKKVDESARISGRCVFVGSGSFHNVHGISWFLRECWPSVRRAVPSATLEIVGSVCYRLRKVPAGVFVRGVLDDLDAVYARSRVAVVPLRMGSGLKVKLVEALAHATPVVTTPVGAQGLLKILPRPFLIAESAEAFATETSRLLRSSLLQAELSAAAKEAARLFEPDMAFNEFRAATQSIARDG